MYILDIETRPDRNLVGLFNEGIKPDSRLKDPVKIAESIKEKQEESIKAMSTDIDYSEIVCIGIKEFEKDPVTMTLQEYADWLEERQAGLGEKEWKTPAESSKNKVQKMITFNGKAFDIPIIVNCGIKQGINLPYAMLLEACDKYRAVNHLDLMEKLGRVYGKQKSLDAYMRIYLGIKKETLGDEFFRNATDEELKKHCLEDLVYTEELYKKFLPLFV